MYQLTRQIWLGLSLLPRAVRRGMAAGLTSISPDRWSRLLAALPARLPAQIGDKLHKFASVLSLSDGDAIYRRLLTHWEPDQVMPGIAEPKGILWDPSVATDMPNLLDRMQFLDLVTYLPDDILTKVDRASLLMADQMELRRHRWAYAIGVALIAVHIVIGQSEPVKHTILHNPKPDFCVKHFEYTPRIESHSFCKQL
jgi:hypothetical protein